MPAHHPSVRVGDLSQLTLTPQIEKPSLLRHPMVGHAASGLIYLLGLLVAVSSLPSRMAAIEQAQHESIQKLDTVAEQVAEIRGELAERQLRLHP